jgi:NAD(P)-dependent dehydrogenase (short-subunit alcohol dehydrogenase family)
MIRSASYPSLEDRVAFVTGGGSGIGASVVEHLCAQRARVAFVDIARAASEAVVASLQARGFLPCDVRDIAALHPVPRQNPIRPLLDYARSADGPGDTMGRSVDAFPTTGLGPSGRGRIGEEADCCAG